MGAELPEDLPQQLILPGAPDDPALGLEEVQQLVLEEVGLLPPEDLAELPPVLLPRVDELGRVEHLVVHETEHKPDIQSALVLVPAAGVGLEGLLAVPECSASYFSLSSP